MFPGIGRLSANLRPYRLEWRNLLFTNEDRGRAMQTLAEILARFVGNTEAFSLGKIEMPVASGGRADDATSSGGLARPNPSAIRS